MQNKISLGSNAWIWGEKETATTMTIGRVPLCWGCGVKRSLEIPLKSKGLTLRHNLSITPQREGWKGFLTMQVIPQSTVTSSDSKVKLIQGQQGTSKHLTLSCWTNLTASYPWRIQTKSENHSVTTNLAISHRLAWEKINLSKIWKTLWRKKGKWTLRKQNLICKNVWKSKKRSCFQWLPSRRSLGTSFLYLSINSMRTRW